MPRMPSVPRPPSTSRNHSDPSAGQPQGVRATRLDIFCCPSIFDVVDAVRQLRSITGPETGPPPNFSYRDCFELLRESRESLGFSPAENCLAFASVDPDSEGQDRFITAISRLDILVEPINFRDASVTLPIREGDKSERHYVRTLAPDITLILGLLLGRAEERKSKPSAIIVTRAFELFRALEFFVDRGGEAAIAFFRRYMDPRFGLAGLFETSSKIRFIDLEPHSERILGCDLRQLSANPRGRSRGISAV